MPDGLPFRGHVGCQLDPGPEPVIGRPCAIAVQHHARQGLDRIKADRLQALLSRRGEPDLRAEWTTGVDGN